MSRIELPLKSVSTDTARLIRVTGSTRQLEAWLTAVANAEEPCLVLDIDGVIVCASMSFATLVGQESPKILLGRGLLDDVMNIVDFSVHHNHLPDYQLAQLPPLMALATGSLARGLIRVQTNGRFSTLDAISTPLYNVGQLAGSLTFFHRL